MNCDSPRTVVNLVTSSTAYYISVLSIFASSFACHGHQRTLVNDIQQRTPKRHVFVVDDEPFTTSQQGTRTTQVAS